MKKVVILPLSLYLHIDQSKAEREFRRLGVSWWSLRWHYLPLPAFLEKWRGPSLPSLFQKYRLGRMTTQQFILAIQTKFPNAHITTQAFKNAWNSFISITKTTKNALREAKTLANKGADIYWLSGTNRLNIDYVAAEVGPLPGKTWFSFQKRKLEKDLLESLINDIRKQHPKIKNTDIVMFFTPPVNPHPLLGWLAWFVDPVGTFKYRQARNYVANLVETAHKLKFTLIEKPATEKGAGILSAIKRLGWFKSTTKKDNTKNVTYVVKHKHPRRSHAITPAISPSLTKTARCR